MRRRDFIAALGSTAAWPLAARAQERMRKIAVLQPGTYDAPARSRYAALLEGLHKLGWAEGRNLQIDRRSAEGSAANIRKYAAEMVALRPDAIVVTGTPAMAPILQATRILPIVFVNVGDPVGAGYVDTLAQPGGNATGFLQFEYSLSGKWPELLKEIAPGVKRAIVLRDAGISSGVGQFAVIQAVAPSLGLEVKPINVLDVGEIERSIAAFARLPNSGLILTASGLAGVNRALVIRLAAQHKLPAVYAFPYMVAEGALMAYGPDLTDQWRRAATYVDRILKGEKPADLPVQAPTKYELVINLKTAKALGLTVPPALLARADEVIE